MIDMRIVELGLLKVDCLLPWTGIINKECCSGIVRNKGLYTQCLSLKKNGDDLCDSCLRKAKNSNSPVMRVECRSESDWRSDKGAKPISYSRYLKDNNITRKEAELKARSLGVELDDSYFVEEKRGRKKKSAIVSDSDSDGEKVEKRKRGRPHKKKADALNDLLKEASVKKAKVKKGKVKKAKVTKDADVSLEKDSLKIFYGVVDNRKEKQSVLWRTKLNEHYTIKQYKIQPKSRPNSKGGLYKCNVDEIDTKTLVEIKDHIEKNYKIINKAKTNDIVNQFKNKTLKNETIITTEDETVITTEDETVITTEDETVITTEDEKVITAEDDNVITAEDETVIEQPITTAVDDNLMAAEDDTLEIDQISLGGLSDDDDDEGEDGGEDDSLDIEQQSVTSLSDHENEEDVEDDQVNKDLDENDDEELDLGNVSDFLEETDMEDEDEEEESSMKPFYIKQSGFTFMGEIIEERTSAIKYTICTKTNAVYDESDREIGTWNPTDKSFTPK